MGEQQVEIEGEEAGNTAVAQKEVVWAVPRCKLTHLLAGEVLLTKNCMVALLLPATDVNL